MQERLARARSPRSTRDLHRRCHQRVHRRSDRRAHRGGARRVHRRGGAAQSPGVAQGRGAAPAPATPPCGPNLPADIKNVAKHPRCFELRTYTVREGSSVDLLHTRFRERTTALFKKHGMTIIG